MLRETLRIFRKKTELSRGAMLFGILAASLIQGSPSLAAREDRLTLKWSELAQEVAGEKVTMALADGAIIEGRIINFSSDEVVMDVNKTSSLTAYPQGRNSVRRSSVSVIHLKQTRGKWRAIATAIGAGSGAVAGSLVQTRFSNEANPEMGTAIASGMIVGGTGAGYFLGRSKDRRVKVITVVSD